jgi:hypothetical protein
METVTNPVNEWRYDLGFAAADELRELAVTMRKVGVPAAQCALGFRIATLMLRIGGEGSQLRIIYLTRSLQGYRIKLVSGIS